MNTLPEAVKAALKIVDVCDGDEEVPVGAMAAIISSAFAPLVEERDRLMVGNTDLRFERDQLKAKLDAVVKGEGMKVSKAAVELWGKLISTDPLLDDSQSQQVIQDAVEGLVKAAKTVCDIVDRNTNAVNALRAELAKWGGEDGK